MEVVETHVFGLLTDTLGEDVAVELVPFRRAVDTNRKAVREFALVAMPVVGVWCQRNDVALPEPWQQGEAQAVVRYLENSGLLDFEADLALRTSPHLCHRAACWPDGMPETLDGEALGLSRDDVEAEEKRRERERQQREIERRSIMFAGTSLDTGDPKFAENLQELAANFMANDETWFERSRQRTRLVGVREPGPAGRRRRRWGNRWRDAQARTAADGFATAGDGPGRRVDCLSVPAPPPQ